MCLPCCKKNQDELDKAAYYEPAIPIIFKNAKLSDLREGVSFIITGVMKPSSTYQRDQALFLNPRTVIKIFIANTKIRNKWGEEVIYQPRPFVIRAGSDFAIQILITDACYMVAANGFHFAEYKHRIPYKEVKMIVIKGDVLDVQVERAVVDYYPERRPESQPNEIPRMGDFRMGTCSCEEEDPDATEDEEVCRATAKPGDNTAAATDEKKAKMEATKSVNALENEAELLGQPPWVGLPKDMEEEGIPLAYYGNLPAKYFSIGRCLRIDGLVHMTARTIRIALQKTPNVWPQPTVALLLQFNFVFRQATDFSAASYNNGKWKEWSPSRGLEAKVGIVKGTAFSLFIVYDSKAFEVYSKGILLVRHEHSMPRILLDTLYIQGDFKLTDVTMLSEYKPK